MRNKLKNIICLMLAVLCMASFSVTAFAYEGGETATAHDAETAADPKEDLEIPYSCIIDEDGNLVITIGGVTDPAELETVGTVVTGGSCLNVRTGAGIDYEIIDWLSPGEEVKVIGSEGDWYEVIVPEKKGYVHGYYLELFEKAGQNSEIDLTMLMYLMGMMFGSLENAGSETIENGKPPFAFTPDGNLTLIDDFLQIEAPTTEDSAPIEKQFITVQSKNGNTFYIVIDRNGDTENVYFLNLVDEADLMALMEDENSETAAPTCSCTDKCVVGAINTSCEICRSNMSECAGKETVIVPQPTEPAKEPDAKKKSANFLPVLVLLIAGVAGGAVFWFKFRKPKTKTSGNSDLEDYDFGEDDEETELDDADLMAETESEDDE